jgi:hypothetical protein
MVAVVVAAVGGASQDVAATLHAIRVQVVVEDSRRGRDVEKWELRTKRLRNSLHL